MSEFKGWHETFTYKGDEPFIIINITSKITRTVRHKLLEHWHEELEIAYVLAGHSIHYIDGQRIQANPGRLIVTNSGSVHSITPDTDTPSPDETATIVLLIHRQFLKDNFPQYNAVRFTNEKLVARPEIRSIMLKLSEYETRQERTPFDALYARGMLLQLLYYMCLEGAASRQGSTADQGTEKLKSILDYIEANFRQPLAQAELAQQFHFSTGYFSHYFKNHTGITFTQYLTQMRLQKASEDLLSSDRTIAQISLDNGFADERSFINAFRKSYSTTPLQFRKSQRNSKK